MYQNYTPNHSAVKVSGSADDTPFAISLNSLASTGRFTIWLWVFRLLQRLSRTHLLSWSLS